jgi:hypothetical protein
VLLWLAPALAIGHNERVFGANALAPGSGAFKYEYPGQLSGTIYSGDRKQPLFNFRRVAIRTNATLEVHRTFTYPDGKPAARERVGYEGDALVLYELHELQIGASGSVRIRRAQQDPSKDIIEFEYRKQAAGPPKVRTEPLRDNTLVADMVGPFLASHWDALARGEKVKCRFIVIPRAETVGFEFLKDSETTQDGREALVVRMAASSLFAAALVEPLLFTVAEAPPHRVLQYVGRTTPKIQERGKWKDLDALTVFDWATAR